MSAIALSWIATIKVGNQTAKQLLHFYAAHNFGRPGFEFKIDTLANQLECSKRSIQNAIKLLIEKNLIIKEARYAKTGQQLSNIIYLNIPQEFVDKFMGEGAGGAPLRVQEVHGEGAGGAPLINNKINNKYNNKELKEACKKKPKNCTLLSDDFYPDEKEREQLSYHAKRTNNSEIELFNKFTDVSKRYKTKSNNWQKTFVEFLKTELPKKTYEDEKGQRRRYDGKSINY